MLTLVVFSSFISVFSTVSFADESKLFSDSQMAVSPQESIPIERLAVIASRDLTGSGIGSEANLQTITLDSAGLTPTKVADGLAQIPGVALNGQGGLWQTFSIRGFSRWRVQSQVAGIPINTERRAGNTLSFIDPALLQTAEVVMGPSSTFYGSGALGGVVNVTPRSIMETRLSASYDTFANTSAMAITSADENSSYGLAYRRAGQDSAANGVPLFSQFKQASGYIQHEARLRPELLLKSILLSSYGKDIGKTNRQYPQQRVTLYPEEQHLLAKMELVATQDWSLGLFAHQQDWQSDVTRPGKRRNLVDYTALDWGLNYQYQWQLADWSGRIGGDLNNRSKVRVDERQYTTDGSLTWQRNNLDAYESNQAIYVDGFYRQYRWTFHSGLRYDYYRQHARSNDRSADKLTGFLSLEYSFAGDWLLTSQLGTGFRFPSLSESFYSGTTGRGAVQGNPKLAPETVTNAEISLIKRGANWQWRTTAFSIWADDYIARISLTPELLSYANIGSGKITGLESRINIQLGDDWSLEWNFQWQQGEDEFENPLADIAPTEHSLNLSYQANEWQVSTKYTHRMNKTAVGPGELPLDDVGLIDIRAQYFWQSDWRLSLAINNLTDEAYTATADDLASTMPGRELSIELEYRFD